MTLTDMLMPIYILARGLTCLPCQLESQDTYSAVVRHPASRHNTAEALAALEAVKRALVSRHLLQLVRFRA